ncbi:MAG: hypothetical protein R2791_21015 [Saprospiraceae bacterium]
MELENCIEYDGKTYYVPTMNTTSSDNWRVIQEFNGSRQILFDGKLPWLLGGNDTLINYKILYKDSLFNIDFFFNPTYVEYLRNIPFALSDTSIEFLAPSSCMTKNISTINNIIESLPYAEKIDFLLRISQQIYYKGDLDVYGREVLFIPEVILYFDIADCEDKSLLFAYLIWHCLHTKTILLTYPGARHMNVGVESGIIDCNERECINIKGIDYIICEPTSLWYKNGEQMDILNGISANFQWPIFN